NGQFCILLDQTIPKVFNELKALSATEFKKWLKLGVHSSIRIKVFTASFKLVSASARESE
ncbi:MAG TPA: hypothetical protein VFM63_14890, partial [Pyrinomonadaceae bacterium]|nr:hypothetical protein [Pyrinomonadaceae bacterium]